MRVIASFRGNNTVFQAWLRAGMPVNIENVVFLEAYKKKKTVSRKTAKQKIAKNIVTPILPDGIA